MIWLHVWEELITLMWESRGISSTRLASSRRSQGGRANSVAREAMPIQGQKGVLCS